MSSITLFVPDLLRYDLSYPEEDPPVLSALEKLLAKARQEALEPVSHYRTLCDLLGLQIGPGQDVPVAAVTRLLEAEEFPEGFWMRADPVHLKADKDGLILFEMATNTISQHDALALAAEIKESIEACGYELEVPVPNHWYIKLQKPAMIQTTELDRVSGRDIQNFLPRGVEAGRWHGLMNEIQMQLHTSDVNKARESRGELSINSVWFWGNGALPQLIERQWSAVYSEDVYVKGLCMLSNTPTQALPVGAEALLAGAGPDAELLVFMKAHGGRIENSGADLSELESGWFEHLFDSLKRREVKQLTIMTEYDKFVLSPNSLKKFWTRVKPINHYFPMPG